MSTNEWAQVIQAQLNAGQLHDRLEKEAAADNKKAYRRSLEWQLRDKRAEANYDLNYKRFELETQQRRDAALRAWETQQRVEARKQQQALATQYDHQISHKHYLALSHKQADRMADQQRLYASEQYSQQEERSLKARRNQLNYESQQTLQQLAAQRQAASHYQAEERRKEREAARNQIAQADLRQKQQEEFKAQLNQRTARNMQSFTPILGQAQQRDLQQATALQRWTQEHEQALTRKAELEAQMKRNARDEMAHTLDWQLQSKAVQDKKQRTALLQERQAVDQSYKQFSESQRVQQLQRSQERQTYRSFLSQQIAQTQEARRNSYCMLPRERHFYKDVLDSPQKPRVFPAVPGQNFHSLGNSRSYMQLPRSFRLSSSKRLTMLQSIDFAKHDPILNPLGTKPSPVGRGAGLALLYPRDRHSPRWPN